MFESQGLLCLVFSHGGCDSRAEPLNSPMEGVIPMKEPARGGVGGGVVSLIYIVKLFSISLSF